jgi:hypothetical protein
VINLWRRNFLRLAARVQNSQIDEMFLVEVGQDFVTSKNIFKQFQNGINIGKTDTCTKAFQNIVILIIVFADRQIDRQTCEFVCESLLMCGEKLPNMHKLNRECLKQKDPTNILFVQKVEKRH